MKVKRRGGSRGGYKTHISIVNLNSPINSFLYFILSDDRYVRCWKFMSLYLLDKYLEDPDILLSIYVHAPVFEDLFV